MDEEWVELLAKRLGPPIFTTGDEIRFNCFRNDCGVSGTKDSHYHLYVNIKEGKYFCQRCQRGGTLEYLCKVTGVPLPGQTLLSWNVVINSFLFPTRSEEVKDAPLDWPSEYLPMVSGTKARAYLAERGITDSDIEFYQLGIGVGKLKNRVVFPDTDVDGNLVYWVARTYGNHKAKYRNADAPRERQVFNLGRIERSKDKRRLVICEGPISAIIAGRNAVSTYGKYVTSQQISRIVAFKAEEYVVAGDGDAVYEAASLASRLFKKGCNVRFVRMQGSEDPADVGSSGMLGRIENALRWSSLSGLEVFV